MLRPKKATGFDPVAAWGVAGRYATPMLQGSIDELAERGCIHVGECRGPVDSSSFRREINGLRSFPYDGIRNRD